ncbi:MAG: hypothetical protein J6T57_02610 [Alphaproteobacteria bacterium]|nr:hypothetical protein [Alphaproteobacteria bacterium]
MKNLLLILAFLIGGFDAYGATARGITRSNNTNTGNTNSSKSTGGTLGGSTTAVRAARSATPVVTRSGTNAVQAPTAANTAPSVVTRRGVLAPQGTSDTKKQTAARAAKQSVISTGTKVAAANQNTVVDEECWNKFSGCMDSFCMLDNANGGRCICSDKNAEYDSILAEIQSLDEQSYQMATVGVERIEMGDDADAVMAKTKEITGSIEKESASSKSKRKSLDLSAWNMVDFDSDADVEDMFSLASDGTSVANKTGDALYRASAKLCNAQITECKSQSKMMELMYQQRVRSDCTAYENSLRQQRTQSAQKLAAAQSAMREAALEQYRSANKYDLGQCTIEFKKCMQTTGGCGEDFTGCVTQQTTRDTLLSSNKDANGKSKTKAPKQTKIKGATTTIEIAAWTYDALESKKPLCMTVTKQCVNVRDQVWDTFLREVAPQVKSAELMAESNLRTSCVSTVSDCFQKACKENMDPNDPDGSYDMCLTRPETLRNLCKVQIDPCDAAVPNLWDYVKARLASMRVDSCTKEFKQCLTSEDRCGKDYTQCVGLDTDTIVRLCPPEKLIGCQYKEGDVDRTGEKDVLNQLSQIAQGIFLNIDNNLLASCQKAVQSKVIEVCGSLSECDAFTDDEIIGTDSLLSYKTNNGNTVIEGLVNFGLLQMKDDYTDIDIDAYKVIRTDGSSRSNEILSQLTDQDATEQRVYANINTVANKAKQKLATIAQDPTIKMCVEGRSGDWRYSRTKSATQTQDKSQDDKARFPHLLDSYNLMVFNSALDQAYLNYRKRLDTLVAKAVEDQNDDVKSMLCAAIANDQDAAICKHYDAVPETGEPICTEYGTEGALGNIFTGDDEMGLNDNGLAIVIKGADITKKLDAITKSKSEFIQTDNEGNMIGSITITSAYSSETNTCNVTSVSTLCKNLDKIITTVEAKKLKGDAGITLADGTNLSTENTVIYDDYKKTNRKEKYDGGRAVQGKIKKLKAEVYHGTYCTEFQEPTTKTDTIKM